MAARPGFIQQICRARLSHFPPLRIPTRTIPVVSSRSSRSVLTHHPTPSRSFHSSSTVRRNYAPRDDLPSRMRQELHRRRSQQAQPLISTEQISRGIRSPSFRVIAILSCGGAILFYVTHLETVPVSGRKRFNCYSAASAEKQGEAAYRQIIQQEGQQGKILPAGDPRVKMVERVLQRLIDGGNLGTGQEGEEVGWDISVIQDPDTANAFVLPGGKVFVYSGILPICQNDSGLAAVLGHEIAHNLAQHAAERMSSMVMVQPLVWALMYLDLYLTGTTMGLGNWLGSLMLDFGVMRPASRQQESEADYIGLMLMAQSCYDPRAAVGLWQRMEQAQKGAPPEWMSTHPSNEHRIARISEWLPKAEEKGQESGCSVTQNYARGFSEAVGRRGAGLW